MTDIRTDMLRITRRRIAKAKRKARKRYGRDQSSWPSEIQSRFSTLKDKASKLQEAMGR